MKAKSNNTNLLGGRDISIPGSEIYDTLDNLGIEEEEDKFYSLMADPEIDRQEETEEAIALNYHWYIMTLKGHSRKSM